MQLNGLKILTDITGLIRNGMWNYGDPFPAYNKIPVEQPGWVPYPIAADVFNGLHSQTGTYFETPGHFPAAGHVYDVCDIPFAQMIDIPAHVLHIPKKAPGPKREPVTTSDIEEALSAYGRPVPGGEAVLVDSGWGAYWDEPFYTDYGPYFTYGAFETLLGLKPKLLSTDFPRWENLEHLEHIFPVFYKQNIWMLAPVINLQLITNAGLLSVLPLNIRDSCCVPCRAFIRH